MVLYGVVVEEEKERRRGEEGEKKGRRGEKKGRRGEKKDNYMNL